MKYFTCPACGKQLIRLEPYEPGDYNYWCDDCDIDICIGDNGGKLYENLIKKENDNNE